MTDDVLQRGIDALLDEGHPHTKHVLDVARTVTRMTGAKTPAEVRAAALQLIRAALDAGVVEVGDMAAGRLTSWGLSTENTIARLESAWPSDRIPLAGEVGWVDLSEKGRAASLARASNRHSP